MYHKPWEVDLAKERYVELEGGDLEECLGMKAYIRNLIVIEIIEYNVIVMHLV